MPSIKWRKKDYFFQSFHPMTDDIARGYREWQMKENDKTEYKEVWGKAKKFNETEGDVCRFIYIFEDCSYQGNNIREVGIVRKENVRVEEVVASGLFISNTVWHCFPLSIMLEFLWSRHQGKKLIKHFCRKYSGEPCQVVEKLNVSRSMSSITLDLVKNLERYDRNFSPDMAHEIQCTDQW